MRTSTYLTVLFNSPRVPASSSRACWYARQVWQQAPSLPGRGPRGSQFLAWLARAAVHSTCGHRPGEGPQGSLSVQACEHLGPEGPQGWWPLPSVFADGRGPAQAGAEGPLVPLATPPPQARTQRERPFSPASMESGSKRRILAVGTSGVHPAAQPPAPSWLVVTEAGPFWKCAADVPVTLPNPCLALVAFS